MLERSTKVDWFRIITDLERAGYSHISIATCVGVAKRTIGGWKQGSHPRWEDEESLLDLWSTVTKSSRGQMPVVGRYDYRG